jgi:hypothetical protein
MGKPSGAYAGDRCMWMRIRLMGLAGAALVGLALATAVPAQADIMDCIETVAPTELKQAVEDAAKAAQCVGQAAAGDAAMIAAIGVITALRAGGAFSSTEECMGMINSTIGKQVAKAVLATPAADTVFSPVKSKLQDIANGDSSESFTDLAGQFVPLQTLLSYMTCGCQIAGLDNQVEEIVNAYVGHVEGCGKFLADAGEFAVDAIESGVDALAEGIKVLGNIVGGVVDSILSCFGFCDDDGSDCAPNTGVTKSLFGQWTTHKIYQFATGCGNWFCDDGGFLKTKPGPDGKTLYTCSSCSSGWALNDKGYCAPCGGMISKSISADNMCLNVVTGYPTDDGGHCTTIESEKTSCCAPGQLMKPVGWKDKVTCDITQALLSGQCPNVEKATTQCVAACPSTQYFDTVTGKCSKCNFDAVPVFASVDSSIGQCKQCPPGLNGVGQTCEPCLPGEVVWTSSPPKKPYGLGSQTQAGPVGDAAKKKKDGLATQKQVAPIAGPPKSPPLSVDIAPPPPPGPRPVTTMAIPGGPIGGLVEGGRCMACPENWSPVYYFDPQHNSLGYCKECPPGTYLEVPKLSQVPLKDPKTGEWLWKPPTPKCVPLDCGRAGVDPNNPHACLPPREAKPAIPGGPAPRACPRGTRRVGDDCVPPTSTLVPRTRLACPPGTVPNATRTSCIAIGRIRPDARAVPRGPAGLRLPTAPTLRAVPTPQAPIPRLMQPR